MSKSRKRSKSTFRSAAAHRKTASADLIREAKEQQRAGKLAAAEELYQRALEDEPENADALHYLGLLNYQRGNGAAAVDLMYRACAARPSSPEFHCNLGMVLGSARRDAEALRVLDEAIRLKPEYPAAYHNRGNVLEKIGKIDEAILAWQRALELQPDFAAVHYSLASSLLAAKRHDEALHHAREAARLNPRSADTHNCLGCVLRVKGELDAAAKAFRTAGQLQPAAPESHSNLGTVLVDLGRPREAVAYYEKAIALKADYADAHWNLGMALLACGEFDRGWLEYEWRRHWATDPQKERALIHPQWNGCSVSGRTVLLICEQGLGDTLQFARYARVLSRRGATVILECQPALRELLARVEGVDQIITPGDRLPRFDTYARLMSVAGIVGTRLGNMAAEVPYLHPDPHRASEWKARLSGPGVKVGIAWQGNPAFANDRARSIPLEAYEPLAAVEGVRLISLQKNAGAEQIDAVADRFRVERLEPALDEGTDAFMDTAAVMKHLDLVVTSDTAIAHLAGALGVKTWVALGIGCDWRWLQDRDDSPWYPTMRLFRQQRAGDWSEVFSRMAGALRDTLSAPAAEETTPVLAPIAPGELIDRLTILGIKSQRVGDPVKLSAVRAELDSLEAIRATSLPRSEQLDELARELRSVNEKLWQIEDDIRAADRSGDFGPAFVELARLVYRTNDQRAELKRRINLLLRSPIQDQKQYQPHGG